MIVVDASAMVEALVAEIPDPGLFELLTGDVHAPHLLDVELASVLRGLNLSGKLDEATADRARADYADLNITRHEQSLVAERVWQLRHQFTSYDATYLALAEALEAPLGTCDTKLAASGHRADVILMPRPG